MTDTPAVPGGTMHGRPGVVLDGDAVRHDGVGVEFVADAAQLAAHAAAIGETRPDRLSGQTAGPTYAFVPLTQPLFDVLARAAGTSADVGTVHTGQQFVHRRPIRAGERLSATIRVVDLRSGQLGGVLTCQAEMVGADGAPVNQQVITVLVPGATCLNPIEASGARAAPAPASAVGPVNAAVRGTAGGTAGGTVSGAVQPSSGSLPIAVAPDLPARYAAASGDRNPIHLDPAFARTLGFPGVILHGMCTLAMACHALEWSLAAGDEPVAVGVEFTRPVLPGDRLTVRWQHGDLCRFDVVNRRQRTVLRGGRLAWTFSGDPRSGA